MLYSLLAALYVLSIGLASSIKALGPTKFGTLLDLCGVGMAIGSVFIAQFGHRFKRRQLTATGLVAIALSLLLLAQVIGALGPTFLLCGLLGAGSALVAIPAQTTIQQDTPEGQRGKVFGLQNNLINIALTLPLVLAGALISTIGIFPVLWILATLTIITAILEEPWKHC